MAVLIQVSFAHQYRFLIVNNLIITARFSNPIDMCIDDTLSLLFIVDSSIQLRQMNISSLSVTTLLPGKF